MLTRGMKAGDIAKVLNIDNSTASRDIKFLTAQSQNYLNDLARSTLPFMYQISIQGIQDVLAQAWSIYQNPDQTTVNMSQRLAALKIIKECHESIFNLMDAGPSIMVLKQMQEKLSQIENR